MNKDVKEKFKSWFLDNYNFPCLSDYTYGYEKHKEPPFDQLGEYELTDGFVYEKLSKSTEINQICKNLHSFQIEVVIDDLANDLYEELSTKQIDYICSWFLARYEAPENYLMYNSRDGGYLWGGLGPHSTDDVLRDEFDGVVHYKIIEDCINKLEYEGTDTWALSQQIRDESGYYDEFKTVSNVSVEETVTEEKMSEVTKLINSITPNSDNLEILLKLIFANLITILESYLSDTFIGLVRSNEQVKIKYISSSGDFAQNIKLNTIFSELTKIDDHITQKVNSYSWHNLAKIEKLFFNVLGINMSKGLLEELKKSVEIRHDIVHRNGKTIKDHKNEISLEEVIKLRNQVEKFIGDIQKQLEKQNNLAKLA